MNTYYYSGEFGYFNVLLLPALEKYISKKNSEVRSLKANLGSTELNVLTIYTFPDYCYIIKNLFGDFKNYTH